LPGVLIWMGSVKLRSGRDPAPQMDPSRPLPLPLSRTHGLRAGLPDPDPESAAVSARLVQRIEAAISAAGGWLPFDRYMQIALYEPGLGYYDGSRVKFGAPGDYVTAPEISPLFARALAAQLAQVFEQASVPPRVLEFGAGSGALADVLIAELARLGRAVERYSIVEVSADLRARQRARLGAAGRAAGSSDDRTADGGADSAADSAVDRTVEWLAVPPSGFRGAIVANEVLDVMPVKLFVKRDGAVLERGVVAAAGGGLAFDERPASASLAREVACIEGQTVTLPDGYGSEVGLAAQAWTASLAGWLEHGVALLVDYGFPRPEYYHAQRIMGTLMCHYRHRAHADPLWLPGLNDVTAHVDFSAVAAAGSQAGLDVLGYTSQSRFLLNCGVLDLLAQSPQPQQTAEAQRLLSEAEMGELIKVIAFGRGVGIPLLGFEHGDRTHRL
jgi:SAM-dependent MidA family methyltransferase